MAVIHGKIGRVRITGTVPTTEAALTADLAAGGLVLTIAAATKRHWSPSGTVLVKTSAATISDARQIDYVRGIVTFSTPHSTALAWTVDTEWMPTSCLGMTRSWSLEVSDTLHDVTVFPCSTVHGWREYAPGLGEATVQLGRLVATSESSAPPFIDRQSLSVPLYVELHPDYSTGGWFEMYARIQGRGNTVSVDDVEQETVTLKADGPVYWTTST